MFSRKVNRTDKNHHCKDKYIYIHEYEEKQYKKCRNFYYSDAIFSSTVNVNTNQKNVCITFHTYIQIH